MRTFLILAAFFINNVNLIADPMTNDLKPFLDYEQRPNAEAESVSEVRLTRLANENELRVEGQVGAIKSGDSWVGFSGVEIASSLFQQQDLEPESSALAFSFLKAPDDDRVISISVIVGDKTFTKEVLGSVISEHIKNDEVLQINADEFEETYRGRRLGVYLLNEQVEDFSKVRIFLKRSKNGADHAEPVPFDFTIDLNELTAIY
ncbi:hypothetical protein N9D31_03650 [Oligoflexaceae bacterium]|nr:hypothetical protein [Oligoflexaceae bacterium]